MMSNVGNAQVYEAKDQRTAPDGQDKTERFHEGKANSHLANDSKDERTLANKLACEEQHERESEADSPEVAALKKDPTAPATMHGNKPSRGAEIDKKLQDDDEEILRKKGAFGPKDSN